ncbi:MAG TPA: ABC transporter permease [Blastocatellia bacterium]|nr:ABC transporter permease [Blastocatellia bacterium]
MEITIAGWAIPFILTGGALLFFCIRRPLIELNAFSRTKFSSLDSVIATFGGIALFIGIWSFASWLRPTGITRIPSPWTTFNEAHMLIVNGTLYEEAKQSFIRVLAGFSIASVIGVSGGLLAGSFVLANRLTLPVNTFFRYIPPTAFVSAMIVYFGIGESYKYAVVFIGVIFFIFQMTIDVVEDLDIKFLEMGLTTGLSRVGVFRRVILPASWPRIVDVLRINLSAAWTFLVAAEIIGADTGLGHLIAISQRFSRIEQLYVAILIFGVIGLLTDWVIQFISNKLFRWHAIQVSK